METKICSKCGKERPIGEFQRHITYCRECRRAQLRNAYAKNKEKRKETRLKYAEKNAEKVAGWQLARWKRDRDKMIAYSKQYMKLHPEKRKEYNSRRNRFAATLSRSRSQSKFMGYAQCVATVDEITAAFTGLCHNPGCAVPESECNRKLALDHDHITGEFRGWLCCKCNSALGMLQDSPDKVVGLFSYITKCDVTARQKELVKS